MDDKTTVYMKPISLPMTVWAFECPECLKLGLSLDAHPCSHVCDDCETEFDVEVLS